MVDLYSKPTISGYNSNPPPDDDSTTSDNAVSWSKHVNKLAGPIKTLVDSINTNVDTLADSLFGKAVTAQSANFNLAASDYGKLFKTSNAITITLLTGSDAGGNFVFAFYNSDATNSLTLGRNGVNINGAASNLTIYPKTGGIAFSDGTDWWVLSGLSQDSVATISGNWTFSGTVTMSAKSMYWAKGSDIASAATLVLGDDGNMFDVTGSTGPITAITVPAGMLFMLQFDSTPTLTHGASLVLPNATSITAVAGMKAICFATAANTVEVLSCTPKSGDILQVVNTQTGAVATGTTTVPTDDTIPQNTEGTEFMTLAITPKYSTSKLKIDVVFNFASSADVYCVFALFQDSTADALAATIDNPPTGGGGPKPNKFTHYMTSGTASATTFKVRAGPTSAATLTFNGLTGGRLLGGVIASSITITEIAA